MTGNSAVQAGNLQLKNNADANDQVLAWSNSVGNVVLTPVGNLFANSTLTANIVILLQNSTPANSTANCVKGQLWSDGNYIYYGVNNNVIKRSSLSSF